MSQLGIYGVGPRVTVNHTLKGPLTLTAFADDDHDEFESFETVEELANWDSCADLEIEVRGDAGLWVRVYMPDGGKAGAYAQIRIDPDALLPHFEEAIRERLDGDLKRLRELETAMEAVRKVLR